MHSSLTPSRKLEYYLLWPGGNTTALVMEPIARSHQAVLAKHIMGQGREIEQVGFFEEPENSTADFRLQMMGGEFCGNGARSAAFLWSRKRNKKQIMLEISGFDKLLHVEISNVHEVKIIIPIEFFKKLRFENRTWIADFSGIRQIISQNRDPQNAQALIQKWKQNFPAVGVINSRFIKDRIIIDTACVWVSRTKTLVSETACASASIAAALAAQQLDAKRQDFKVVQPSGELYFLTMKKHEIVLRGKIDSLGKKKIALPR